MTSPSRPKLSVMRHDKTIDDIVPLPQIEQGLDRTRRNSPERKAVNGFRQQAHEAGRLNGDQRRIAACDNGDGKGVAIAAFLDPVCGHFDLDDDATASLAAFTRKLMAGGRPRRGSQSQGMRPIDAD